MTEDNFLMMDANQKWDVPEAIECMKMLAPYKPLCKVTSHPPLPAAGSLLGQCI